MFLALRPVIVGFLLIALTVSACSVRKLNRRLILPDSYQTLDHDSPFLKVHLKNGDLLILSEWDVEEGDRVVTGFGALFDGNRVAGDERLQSASLDSVALFETNTTSVSSSILALTVFTGASLTLTAYCIANPKSCFGSCPTFYVTEGDREILQAEGFSASIAPSLEAADVDALVRAQPRDGRLTVTMVNEALETHVVRHVDVLAVPRPPGGRVATDGKGNFWNTSKPRAPTVARCPEGDCREVLSIFDMQERFSASDSTDLSAREIVDLEFAPGGEGSRGLWIGSRQTLLSTYLFYQTLAYMGSSAGHWLSLLERREPGALNRFSGIGELLGGIEVWIEDGGEWVRAGEIQEHGPLAVDLTLVPLPRTPEDRVRIQLRMTRGKHRLDYVALVDLHEAVEPLRLAPREVQRQGVVDAGARERLTNPRESLVTLPGDRYVLVYDLPNPEGPGEWDLFLESRGYYLEWIREPWLAEESAPRLAEVLFTPARALRRMAPEFKAVEGEMEAIFWKSQYARP